MKYMQLQPVVITVGNSAEEGVWPVVELTSSLVLQSEWVITIIRISSSTKTKQFDLNNNNDNNNTRPIRNCSLGLVLWEVNDKMIVPEKRNVWRITNNLKWTWKAHAKKTWAWKGSFYHGHSRLFLPCVAISDTFDLVFEQKVRYYVQIYYMYRVNLLQLTWHVSV